MDIIQVGLAGNLSDFTFVNARGETVTGDLVLYNGSPAGYTSDPQEQITYISKHDNETLFDIIQYKAPLGTSTAVRARMQTLGNSIVMFSQGFRSSRLAMICCAPNRWIATATTPATGSTGWTSPTKATTGAWAATIGRQPGMWPTMQPLLANPDLAPTPADIAFARDTFRELLQIRSGSPLFRLQTAVQVQDRLQFHNVTSRPNTGRDCDEPE
ncbi:MAG: DUF3372 domain-containing protein [Ardenticatenaceae bacterium]|nr:DUF3372 domain-containing protein [Ardenticatenaceae bacterium]